MEIDLSHVPLYMQIVGGTSFLVACVALFLFIRVALKPGEKSRAQELYEKHKSLAGMEN